MASRIFHTQRTANNGSVVLAGFFTVTSGGIATTLTSEGRGVSCSRMGTGDFMFTLTDKYKEISSCNVVYQGTTLTSFSCQTLSRVPSTKKVRAAFKTGSQGESSFLLDSTTANATASGVVLAVPTSGLTLLAAKIASNVTVTKDATDYIRVKFHAIYGTGTLTTLATFSGAAVTLTAQRIGDMPLNSAAAAELQSGRLVKYAITKVGAGHTTPSNMMVQLQYSNYQAKTIAAGKLHYSFVCRNSTVK